MFNRQKKKKKKIPTRTKLLWVSVSAIIIFTIANFVLLLVNQSTFPDSAIYSWYGFWSFELFNLSRITINRTKNGYYDKTESVQDEDGNEE